MRPLTDKRELFCQLIFKGAEQGVAYMEAYPGSKRWKPESVQQVASRLRAVPEVDQRIMELRGERAEANGITVDRVLQEYAKLAFTDLPGIVKFDGARMMVEDFEKLTPAQRSCIQSFKVKNESEMIAGELVPVQYVEVKLYSKQAALDKLAEFLGIGKDRGAEEGDDGPVYIGFQQNIQNNITVVEK